MIEKDTIKKHKLTVFLIKEGYNTIESFLNVDGFNRIDVSLDEADQATLIYKGGFLSKPSWVTIFENLQGFDSSTIWNQSSRAIFVVKHIDRYFCFTFGHARHLIDELSYERNFGLIVALNLSDPDAIKSIDKTNIGHVALHSKEQATRDIDLLSFEFNGDIDLLKSITGKSETYDEDEKETYSGRDSVTINTKVTLKNFINITERLYNAFIDPKYKENYPWIDKINEVRDKEIINLLDKELLQRIVNKNFDLIWIAIPEIVIWEDIKGFSYEFKSHTPKGRGPSLYHDLDIEKWYEQTNICKDLTAKQLKNKKIYTYWEDGRPPSNWNVYRCLNAEIKLNGNTYILNDSIWYNIETDFVRQTNEFYYSVPEISISLPNYESKTEPAYLKYVSKNFPEFALMDRKNIMIGGRRSRIEFCDLFSLNNDIIHVKKYGGSSLLSHLFFQALVSGENFLYEEKFRQEVNNLLPDTHKFPDTNQPPISSNYNVCIAIMSEVPGPLELPFFSKVSFKHTVKSLTNMGYKVYKYKINR